MKMTKTFAIAVALLGLGYGVSFAQSIETPQTSLSDDDYLALANVEAFDMFATEPAPLTPRATDRVYILGLGQVAASFYCALDVLDAVSETIDTDNNGILYVEVADIAAYIGSENCFEASDTVALAFANQAGS